MSKYNTFEFRILCADVPDERQDWVAAWQSWPQCEVYAHPAYLDLFAEKGTRSVCAFYCSPMGSVLYPFLWRAIPGSPATDIASAYGYGGPAVWATEDHLQVSADFWNHFNAWATQAGVVSEFVRFNPAQQNLTYPGLRTQKLLNVIRSLDLDEDQLWYDVKHKVRKNVKRARQSGVAVEVDVEGRRLDEFLAIYYGTMDRRLTASEYYFKRGFFERLIETLPGQFAFFHALLKDEILATELVLVSEENIYSFLGGTEESSFALRPNDLLKFEIILWAKSAGKRRFVLGGGKSMEDGIFKYKQAFAPSGIVPFHVGTRVLDHDAYERLAGGGGAAQNASEGFFPVYRAA